MASSSSTPHPSTMMLFLSLLTHHATSSPSLLQEAVYHHRHRRLPQHRIRSPKRLVPYPENHPLGRHLQTSSIDNDDEYYNEDDLYIVGGDGWSGNNYRRMKQRRKQQQNRLLHDNNDAASPTDQSHHQRGDTKQPLEQLQHATLYNYWTVTGRNLVNEANDNGDEDESTESLLVDALQEMNYDNNETRLEQDWLNDTTQELAEVELYEGGESSDGAGTTATEESSSALHPNKTWIENSTTATASTSSQYQPLRLRAVLTEDESSGSRYLTSTQRRILMEDMINPALYAWSKALHVIPVGGGDGNLVVDESQLFDGVSCGPGLDSGLPSVKVPKEHLTDGLEDTDTVLYLSVSFTEKANDNSIFSRNRIPFLHGGEAPVYRGSTRKREDSLLVDNDEKNNQTYIPSLAPSQLPTTSPSETEPFVESRPQCPGTYLASATYCSTDQYDRPMAGILSICINDIQQFFHDKNQIKRNIITIMHEMSHILGFNVDSMAHFRDGDTGEPLTPRDANGDVPDVKVECTGIHPRIESSIPLPSSNITTFKSVRGGVRAATIVTPTVKRMARNMFGCQNLNGAELESGEWQLFAEETGETISAGECIGDHWERRLFRTDLMNPIVDDVSYSLYISSLTLAYFADAGWYKVDTRRIAPASIWGRNAGCNFVNQKCVTRHGGIAASNNAFFCNNFLSSPETDNDVKKSESIRSKISNKEIDEGPKQEIHGCNLDSSSKAVCSIVEYDLELPNEYSYFGNTKFIGGDLLGGSDPTLDYCPVFQGYSNGKCGSETAQQYVGVKKSLEVFGESNSRCVIGNVDRERTALCLPMACVIEDQTLMVKVDGYWKSCLYAGQIISVWWNRKDYVVCPDPSHLCPTFYCPNDCFKEGGVCDYRTGQCMCTLRTNVNSTSHSSWLSNYYSTPILEPCSGSGHLHTQLNSSSHITERIDTELTEYYVKNTTYLLDDRRDFDDKVSRMFAQMSSGEVVGLVASFMLFVLFSYIIWYQLVKCYHERLLGKSLTKVRSSVNSLSGLLRNSSLASLTRHNTDEDNDTDMPSSNGPPTSHGNNPQKDKMVATLLVQNRVESTVLTERIERQARLELSGMGGQAQTTVHGETTAAALPTLINRSELPPLPSGGRVLAVIGAHIVEDDNEDARTSATSATHATAHSMTAITDDNIASEYTSPLYQYEDEHHHDVWRHIRSRHSNNNMSRLD